MSPTQHKDHLFTTRFRRMGEGNIFSLSADGGYPHPSLQEVPPCSPNRGGGTPSFLTGGTPNLFLMTGWGNPLIGTGWGTPIRTGREYAPSGLDEVPPFPLGTGWGSSTCSGLDGGNPLPPPPHWDWMGYSYPLPLSAD